MSGAHLTGRNGWSDAVALAEAGPVDAVVATKIDRVSRSVAYFASLVCRAKDNRWNLVVLDIALDLSSPTGEFVATIMCAAARLERRMISRRTKDDLVAAKAERISVGRLPGIGADVARRPAGHRATGVTLAEVADRLTADGVPTARGGDRWWPSTVRALLNRAA